MGNTVSDRKNARCFSLKFSRNTDADIIARLDSQDSVQAYIKQLIRNDINETKGETKMITRTYRINPEYIDLYGADANSETVLTGVEIIRLADEWEKPVAEIIAQLIPEQETAEISIDNGKTATDPAEAIETVGWAAIVAMMDDSLREYVADELAPCSEEKFLRRYLELSPENLIIG